MDSERTIPISLKIVAWLFIVGGICSVIEVLVSLMHHHISINFGVLGILIGPGLLRLNRGWRTCALVLLWIALIGVPIAAVLFMAHRGPVDFKVFGQKVGQTSRELALVMAGVLFLLALWQYRVLTRADIRALFGISTG